MLGASVLNPNVQKSLHLHGLELLPVQEALIERISRFIVDGTPMVMLTGESNQLHMAVVLSALNLVDVAEREPQILVIGGGREVAEMIGEEFGILSRDCGIMSLSCSDKIDPRYVIPSSQIICGTSRSLSSCTLKLHGVKLVILDEARYCFHNESEKARLQSILSRLAPNTRFVFLSSHVLNHDEMKYISVNILNGQEPLILDTLLSDNSVSSVDI